MDSKCKYWMLLLTLLCVISLGFSYINYFSGQDVCTAFGAFVPMLDALYYSLDSDEDGIDDIFSTLRLFVSKIQTQSFAMPGGYGDVHGKYIITDPQHPFYNRTIDEYMNSRLKPVKTIDDKIRNHKNYKFIKVSYEGIMALFNEKVSKIILDPQNLSFSR